MTDTPQRRLKGLPNIVANPEELYEARQMTDKARCCLKLLSVTWEKKATQMTDKSGRYLKGDELLSSNGGKGTFQVYKYLYNLFNRTNCNCIMYSTTARGP